MLDRHDHVLAVDRRDRVLGQLNVARDKLAGVIKGDLENAAFNNARVPNAVGLTSSCNALISFAERFAN